MELTFLRVSYFTLFISIFLCILYIYRLMISSSGVVFFSWLHILVFFVVMAVKMYNNNNIIGLQSGGPHPSTRSGPNNPFGSAFHVAGSGLIRGGLGAYGEKILGSSSEYVQSNVSSSYHSGFNFLFFIFVETWNNLYIYVGFFFLSIVKV